MRRRLLTLLASVPALATALVTVTALGTPAPAAAAHIEARNPIVFVHGWNGDSFNWATMIGRLRADGYAASELFAWDYNHSQSNAVTAQQLGQFVDQVRARTGASQVDVVSHSMGGLNSRHWVKFLGGAAEVDDWVNLGGPNHGTTAASLCFWDVSCFQMRAGSSFLRQLNSGDETPGAVQYTTVWSPCDEVINPDTSTVLSGATNVRTGCVGHIGLLADPGAYAAVRSAVG
jgi:triacylglycerol lipase